MDISIACPKTYQPDDEMEERQESFANYQVNSKVMSVAKEDAIFLHCLPAHRGEEVTAEVIDGE